jgi:hypothetical protein
MSSPSRYVDDAIAKSAAAATKPDRGLDPAIAARAGCGWICIRWQSDEAFSCLPEIRVLHGRLSPIRLRWKGREQRKLRSDLAANDVNIAITHPDMGRKTVLVI